MTALSRSWKVADDTVRVPWRDGFELGAGVDAVTGRVTASALDLTSVALSAAQQTTECYYRICSNNKSTMDAFTSGVDVGGALNVEPLGVDLQISGHFASIEKIEHSTHTFSLILRETTTWDVRRSTIPYALTSRALGLARSSSVAFRHAHGDYFISGVYDRSEFEVIFNFNCVSSAQKDESTKGFSNRDSPRPTLPGMPSMAVSLDVLLMRMGALLSDAYTITSSLRYSGLKPDAEAQPSWLGLENKAALDAAEENWQWYRRNRAPRTVAAELRHYGRLAWTTFLPLELPVSTEVFMELASIRQNLFKCAIIAPFLQRSPARAASVLTTCLFTVLMRARLEQPRLGTIDTLRQSLAKVASSLLRDMTSFNNSREFWEAVQAKQQEEPKWPTRLSCQKQCTSWSYGWDDPKQTQHDKATKLAPGRWWKRREETQISIPAQPDDSTYIVGWAVRAVTKRGSWGLTPHSRGNILKHTAAIAVWPCKFREAEWELVVYRLEPGARHHPHARAFTDPEATNVVFDSVRLAHQSGWATIEM